MDLLELRPPVTADDIKRSRRRLARIWHPDVVQTARRKEEYGEQMKAINAAADALLKEVAGSACGSYSPAREERQATYTPRGGDPQAQRQESRGGPEGYYVRSRAHPEWGVGIFISSNLTDLGSVSIGWVRAEFHGGQHSIPIEDVERVDFSEVRAPRDWAGRFIAAARTAEQEKDYERAAALLRHARRFQPDDPDLLRSLTMALWKVGDCREGISVGRTWSKAEPTAAPHRVLSHIYEEVGWLNEAIDSARQVTDLDPTDATGWRRLARLLGRAGDETAAGRARAEAERLNASEGLP